MQFRGQLIFPDFRRNNQVTVEGADAVAKALALTQPVSISNILYIVDDAAIAAIQSYIGGANYKALKFENLYYPDAYGTPDKSKPAFTNWVYGCAAGESGLGKGGIIMQVLPSTESEVQIQCNTAYNVGVWPSQLNQTPIKAMALILNGNTSLPTAFDGSSNNLYNPTGNEVLFAFVTIDSYLAYHSGMDNEFSWNIFVSVK